VRVLRFIALLLVVVIAYSAQFILHPPLLTTSSSLLPTQISALLPDLSRVRGFIAGDLRDLAIFFLAVAAITFGLLALPWPLTRSPLATVPATFALPNARRRQRLAWLLVALAIVLVAFATLLVRIMPTPDALTGGGLPFVLPRALLTTVTDTPWLPELLWAGGLLFFFVGCGLFPWRFAQNGVEEAGTTTNTRTPGGWWRLLLLLLVAALLYGWQLLESPLLLHPDVAQVALTASDWVTKGQTSLFAHPPLTAEPGLYLASLGSTITALLFRVTHDLLLSVRLAGFLFALITIGATWLLGVELFQRTPSPSAPDPTTDQGQWPAFVAALLVMTTTATLLFSRLPVLLEMVGWGVLGCWALLRGLRTGDRLAVGISGVLLALSALLYSPGIAFVLAALCWWLGYGVVQSGWAPHHLPQTLPGRRFRGYFLLWLIGLLLTAAPTVTGHWFGALPGPQLWQGTLAAHWQPTLLAFAQPGDASQLGGLMLPLFHPLLTPMLCLAVGVLCFNFDRRAAWFLLTWVAVGLLCAMVLPTQAPSWPALLPVVPATGLILALGLDRLRATVLYTAGAWSNNLFNYLLLGLFCWIGVQNGVAYYDFAQEQTDAISAVGRELRTTPADQLVYVIGLPATTVDSPQVRFFTNDWQRPRRTTVIFSTDLPVELPINGTVLLVPSETATTTLAALQSRYPDGTLTVRRDHRANVLLYHYRVAPKSP
jgi:hypothetical protein